MRDLWKHGRGGLRGQGRPGVLRRTDASREKHVPVIDNNDKGIKVKVGSAPHSMEELHYTEWIEIIVGGKSCRVFLKPGQPAEAEFPLDLSAGLVARFFCNIHGQWKALKLISRGFINGVVLIKPLFLGGKEYLKKTRIEVI